MIILSSITDTIQVALASTVTTRELECFASWRDITAAPSYVAGRTSTLTEGTFDVEIVESPIASTQRVIDHISIYNSDTVSATVTVKFNADGTSYTLWKGTLAAGTKVGYEDGQGWVVYNTSGTPVTSGLTASDVQSQTTAGAGTWTKPTSFTPKFVEVVAWGAGGGGGAGASLVTVSCGGAGGGGGACSRMIFRASDLGDTVAFSVGAGGLAGAPGAAGAAGGDGGIGGNTTFGTTLLIAGGACCWCCLADSCRTTTASYKSV